MIPKWTVPTALGLLAAAAMLAVSGAFVSGCADKEPFAEPHWFNCKPILARLDECGILVSFDGETEADPEEAYNSCQFAKGNMWVRTRKCYRETETCEELGECLFDHGFLVPGEGEDDDTSIDDDSAADDDTFADDDTAADDDTE
ncbi:MAG: hypothetical protein M5R36_24955 [Deltaproteobacteria bacterium]|nr:hypothetical protein [Deltaproteobacteria bacterium]